MLTITSPPLKEVRELAQRSMCKGGMLYENDIETPKKHRINIKVQITNKPFVRKKIL